MRSIDQGVEKEIIALRETLSKLRGKDGCPWDKEQEIDDIISYLIDESYELLQAEKSGEVDKLIEELGDVIFIIVFLHELLLEKRKVGLPSIISKVHKKIIKRHPHVFGKKKAKTSSESIESWEKIKREERKGKDTLLENIPLSGLPPIRKALAVQKETCKYGFDWPDAMEILEKLEEEISELKAELKKEDTTRDNIKREIGDLFFTVINIARKLSIDPENAIELSTLKFIKRFTKMQKESKEAGKNLSDMSLDEQEKLWARAKKKEG